MVQRKRFCYSLVSLIFVFALLSVLAVPLAQPVSAATTWYVNPGESIQAAIDVASPGDTIIVRDGTYIENVDVNKDHLTIQSENGAGVTTVRSANPGIQDKNVFTITADHVTINRFTVQGATQYANAGIYLNGSNADNIEYCTISNNIISNNERGINAYHSANNILAGNTLLNNGLGIFLYFSSVNTLIDTIANSNYWGIYLAFSPNNILTNNQMFDNNYNFYVQGFVLSDYINNVDTSNKINGMSIQYLIGEKNLTIDSTWDIGYLGLINCEDITVKDIAIANNGAGLMVSYSNGLTLDNINVSNNHYGIYLYRSYTNVLVNNIVSNNTWGLYLEYSYHNDLVCNTALNCCTGITLDASYENILSENTVSGRAECHPSSGFLLYNRSTNNIITNNVAFNNNYGIYFPFGNNDSQNIIYLNNLYNNDENVSSQGSPTNTWHSPSELTYAYHGNVYTSYLGNYYSDYAGSDGDGDGIGDSPYPIDGDNDNYPLVEPFENYIYFPYFNQCDEPWRNDDYDHISETICSVGCALTSAVMILNYYGVETDPRELNNWLRDQFTDNNGNGEWDTGEPTWGYSSGGDVNWLAVAEFSNGVVSYLGREGKDDAILNADLCCRGPVILNVPNHFVVATGNAKVNGVDTWNINDPGYRSRTTLLAYGNDYSSMRRFGPATDDSSAMLLRAHSPVELYVTDSQGRSIGINPATGELHKEIPNAKYYVEEPLAEGSGAKVVEIFKPINGDYQVKVIGTGTGQYLLDNYGYDVSGSISNVDTFSGDIIPEAVHEYFIPYSAGANYAPVANVNGPYAGLEGAAISLNATGSYDPDGTISLYEWDFNEDCIYDCSSVSPLASCIWGDNLVGNVTLKVTDNDGFFSTDQAEIILLNVAPTITDITAPMDPVPVDTVINVSGNFTDPGFLDTHTAEWHWGDSTTSPGTISEVNGSGNVTGSHAYTEPGVYTVSLNVTDDDGGWDTTVFEYVVVYDPSAGFVTGGGWISSPEGAYMPDPALVGKATFGFVSRYKKGAKIPTGETEFQFKVADLNFHSSSYQWLVIAGPNAKYKGSGTINGEGEYGFMLTATDEMLTPSTDVDMFRIKIWDITTGFIIYDNEMGESDDSYACQEIGGGSIVIHKK